MKKKDIRPANSKGQYHGYQEWYVGDSLALRNVIKNGRIMGYLERHMAKITNFYIR